MASFLSIEQHRRPAYSYGKSQHKKDVDRDEYNPWQDISGRQTDQVHRSRSTVEAEIHGFDLLFEVNSRVSFNDLDKNNVDPLRREMSCPSGSSFESQEPGLTDSGPSPKQQLSELNWEKRGLEMGIPNKGSSVHGNYKVYDCYCDAQDGAAITVSGEWSSEESESLARKCTKQKKRRHDEYPKWSLQDTSDKAERNKGKGQVNKNSLENKRSLENDVKVGCSQCKQLRSSNVVIDGEIISQEDGFERHSKTPKKRSLRSFKTS